VHHDESIQALNKSLIVCLGTLNACGFLLNLVYPFVLQLNLIDGTVPARRDPIAEFGIDQGLWELL
jgi:hypothetical protein